MAKPSVRKLIAGAAVAAAAALGALGYQALGPGVEGPELAPMPGIPTVSSFKYGTDINLGQCHAVSNLGDSRVTWAYDQGGGDVWSVIEPTEDNYVWDELDESVSTAYNAGKKLMIAVTTNLPFVTYNVVPSWALNDGVMQVAECGTSMPNCGVYYGNKAWQQDKTYYDHLSDLLTQVADRYDSLEPVAGILMMSGGNTGEMSQYTGGCYLGCPGGIDDPDNVYIGLMKDALATWGIYETEEALASSYVADDPYILPAFKAMINQGYNLADMGLYASLGDSKRLYPTKFDYYYAENTKRLISLYRSKFQYTPIVVQLGNGPSGRMVVAYAVADYVNSQHAPYVWLKQNGFGNDIVPEYAYSYDKLFYFHCSASYAATRCIYEGGRVSAWFDSTRGGELIAGEEEAHNSETMTDAISAGVSATCLQDDFFINNWNGKTFNLPTSLSQFQSLLIGNVNSIWAPLVGQTPPNTYTPTATSSAPSATYTATPLPTATPTGPTPTWTHTNTPGPSPTFTHTPTPSGEGTILYPEWDTYIYQYQPTTSFGSSTELRQYYDDRQRSLMKFDLSSVPGYSTINSAKLKFYAVYASGGPTITAMRLLRGATDAATWYTLDGSTAWYMNGAGAGDVIGSYGSVTLAGGWNELDITDLVQAWVNGTVNFGLLLDSTGGSGYVTVSSLEGSATLRPRLVIDYTAPTATPTGAPTATPTTAPTWTPVVATVVASSNWDTYINASSPDASYDTNTKLYVKENYTWESLIRPWTFATVVPANSTIYSATLNLRHYYCSAYPVTIDLHRVCKDVDIVDTTYNDASATESWGTAGAKSSADIALSAESTVPIDSGNAWHAWPIVNIAQGWANGTYSKYGVLLRSDDPGTDYCDFASGDNATTGDRPYFYFKFDPPTPTPTLTPTPDFRLALGIERVVNTSFELRSAADFEDWTEVQGDGTVGASTSASHWGATSARLVAGTTNRAYIHQNILVSELTDYALAFWNYGDGTNDGGYRVNDYTQSGTIVNFTSTGHTGTTWKVFYVPFTTPAGCQEIRILFYSPAAGSGGQVWFDDVSLIQTSGAYKPTVQPGDVITHTIFITNPSSLSDVQLTSRYTRHSSDPRPSPLGATPPATWDDTWDTWRWYTLTVDATPQHFSSIWQVSDRGEMVATERGMSQVQHDSTYWITATADAQYWVATHTPTPTPIPTHTPTATPTITNTPTPTATPAAQVFVNEIHPLPTRDWVGSGVITDSAFIELYNHTDEVIDLSWARVVVSSTDGIFTYTLPYSTTIDAGGHLALYHAQTLLPMYLGSGDGEYKLLTWEFSDTTFTWTLVLTDTVTVSGGPTPGASYGRFGDGAATWLWLEWPSPGESNTMATPTSTPTATATPS